MRKGVGVRGSHGLYRGLVRAWFALARRKIRLLYAADMTVEGPALFAVSYPADFLSALVLAIGIGRPAVCLLPKDVTLGPFARFLARRLEIIGDEGESGRPSQEAIDILTNGGALLVFADRNAAGQIGPDTLSSKAAALVTRAQAPHIRRRIPIHPVHLFLCKSGTSSREILIYVDTAVTLPQRKPGDAVNEADLASFSADLESRFQENAFRLRPADLEYFLTDIEEILRTGLQEDWASRPDWKQDVEDFGLSRLVTEWVMQTHYLDPGRLVALRQHLDDYHRAKRECALRELVVAGGDSPLGSGWRKALLWCETLLGLPIALYGLLNHLAIGLVLFLAGSFRRSNSRSRGTEWSLRAVVTVVFYVVQILLVGHWQGRAAAGYYAPSLPASGAYLWRYVGLVGPQARRLFLSLTIPALKRKLKRLRNALLEELDYTLTAFEEKTSVTP